MTGETQQKYEGLLKTIRFYKRAVVAFSGGVDSTLLAYAAAEALGRDNVICLTARSAFIPAREWKAAVRFCAAHGFSHKMMDFNALQVTGVADNPPDRCYLCKLELFSRICSYAREAGIETVLEGSNADDASDYRPGMRAITELDVKSPLLEAGLTKGDIRKISKVLGLQTWDKPSYACLASRFVYGERITPEKLAMVDKAEQFLFSKGYPFVRVRVHGKDHYIARIEARPEDIAGLALQPLRDELAEYYKDLGFAYAALDLAGYRTGSMNEVLKDSKGDTAQ